MLTDRCRPGIENDQNQHFGKKYSPKKSNINLKNLKGKSLAIGLNNMSFIAEALFSKLGIDESDIKIVKCPKDSDAIFGLILGKVEIAMVRKFDFEQLSKLNNIISKKTRVIFESEPIRMPIIYNSMKTTMYRKNKIKNLFKNRNEYKLHKVMETLGIDAWKDILEPAP